MKRAPIVAAVAGVIVIASGVGGTLYAHQSSKARTEAHDIVKAVADSAASAPVVIARLGGRPPQDFGEMSVAVQRRSVKGNDLSYEIVADVHDKRRCIGAIEAGREGASDIRANQSEIKGDDPAAACEALAFPAKLSFGHRADLASR